MGLTKIPDLGPGIDEAKYGFLLFACNRYAHINLPTMRGLNAMMVMLVRELVVHVRWQYINAKVIWQAAISTRSE